MDQFDKAQELEMKEREESIRRAAREVPPGRPGECELCGEWSGRLVNGTCAHCRDKWKLD